LEERLTLSSAACEIRVRIHHDRGLQLADAMNLCHDGMESYASAVALLAVHSAISFSDAVLIRLTGQRSHGKNHWKAIDAITGACKKAKIQTDGVKHLDKLVRAKTDISYGDKEVDAQTVNVLYVAAGRFQAWAEHVLRSERGSA
jgi:hypothetical protein